MVLTQGSLDGLLLCPLKSCNFRVLVQNSPPFLQDCTIGGKLLGDYQQSFKYGTNFMYVKGTCACNYRNQHKGTTAPSDTSEREPIWRSWSRVEGCKPLLNLLKLLVDQVCLHIIKSALVGTEISYQRSILFQHYENFGNTQGLLIKVLLYN